MTRLHGWNYGNSCGRLMAENAAPKQRRHGRGRPFEPGQSGNPAGKSKGTRHRVTQIAEQMLDGEAEALVRKAIEIALAGDAGALRLLLDRIVPPRRDRPVPFAVPPLKSPADAVGACAAVAAAVADGDLTPMYGPAVRCKRISSIWLMRSCINVSGL
jgi:Family of unknown function (DUF5681)